MCGNCFYMRGIDDCLGKLTEELFHTELHFSLKNRSFLLRQGSIKQI